MTGHRTRQMCVAILSAVILAACSEHKGLSEGSKCSDWNQADTNARGTYLQVEYKKLPQLNAYSGYANGGISQYCGDDPAANLGVITRKVANS